MDARTSFVIDHFHAGPTSKADHSLIETTEVLASSAIFPEPITKPILYQGASPTPPHQSPTPATGAQSLPEARPTCPPAPPTARPTHRPPLPTRLTLAAPQTRPPRNTF